MVKLLVQLHLPCFLGLTNNEKIAGLRLSIPSTSRILIHWLGISLQHLEIETHGNVPFAALCKM